MKNIALFLVFACTIYCACGCKRYTDTTPVGSERGGSSSAIAVDEVSSEKETSFVSNENKSSSSLEASSKTSSKTETVSSKPTSTSSKVDTSSKTGVHSSTLNTSSKVSVPDGWLTDVTIRKASPLLTYTQADVGKVIGYSDMFNQYITVAEVTEGTTLSGLKFIEVRYSPTGGTSIGECEYCHAFPCPGDGRKTCPKYDIYKDDLEYCQDCGRKSGDGRYGTCTQRWREADNCYFCNELIPVNTCHTCINPCQYCGRSIGKGNNGTCYRTYYRVVDMDCPSCGITIEPHSCHTCGN